MAIVDAFGNRCDRALKVHFRKVHRIEFDVLALIKHTQEIFGKYNILLQLGSLQSVHMDKPSHARLAVVEPAPKAGGSTAEQTELYERFGVNDLHSVTAFLVFELEPPASLPGTGKIFGAASHLPHRPAIFLARDVRSTTIAHELGHVLMEADHGNHHTNGVTNVMQGPTPDNRMICVANPQFSARQLLLMRRSPLLRVC
jgi:hypothetical protein